MPGPRRGPIDCGCGPTSSKPVYVARGDEWLGRPCSILISLATTRARRSATRPARRFGPWERTGFYSLFRKLTGFPSILRDRAGALLRKFIAALALISLIAVPSLTQIANAAPVSPSSSAFGSNGY